MMLLCLYTLSIVSHPSQALAFIHTQLQEFEVLVTPINMECIREKIALFIVLQIIDQKSEFHCANIP
jgi:hypothetical protein